MISLQSASNQHIYDRFTLQLLHGTQYKKQSDAQIEQ